MWRVKPQTTTASDGTILLSVAMHVSRYLGFTASSESNPITCCRILPVLQPVVTTYKHVRITSIWPVVAYVAPNY